MYVTSQQQTEHEIQRLHHSDLQLQSLCVISTWNILAFHASSCRQLPWCLGNTMRAVILTQTASTVTMYKITSITNTVTDRAARSNYHQWTSTCHVSLRISFARDVNPRKISFPSLDTPFPELDLDGEEPRPRFRKKTPSQTERRGQIIINGLVLATSAGAFTCRTRSG